MLGYKCNREMLRSRVEKTVDDTRQEMTEDKEAEQESDGDLARDDERLRGQAQRGPRIPVSTPQPWPHGDLRPAAVVIKTPLTAGCMHASASSRFVSVCYVDQR